MTSQVLAATLGEFLAESNAAVVVEDGTAYLSVERALTKATLHESMELHAQFEAWPEVHASPGPRTETLIEMITRPGHTNDGIFGRVTGHFSIAGVNHRLEAVARLGRSLIGIGNGAFNARRRIWAAFPSGEPPHAVEARALIDDCSAERTSARVLDRGRWTSLALQRLKLTPATPRRPPNRIASVLRPAGEGEVIILDGEVQSFVMLSRPGPSQCRIITSLGFASFRIGDHHGAGMFECSHRGVSASRATAEAADADNGES